MSTPTTVPGLDRDTAMRPDFPFGLASEASRTMADTATEPTPTDPGFDLLAMLAPSVGDDRQFRDWWDRAGHRGASPAVARAMWHALIETDVRHTLGAIRVPTLVLHRTDNAWTKADHSRYLARHIEGARLEMLPGADDLWWVGETDDLLCEIEEFLTGRRPAPESNRVWPRCYSPISSHRRSEQQRSGTGHGGNCWIATTRPCVASYSDAEAAKSRQPVTASWLPSSAPLERFAARARSEKQFDRWGSNCGSASTPVRSRSSATT
jgi:hypothetical protein